MLEVSISLIQLELYVLFGEKTVTIAQNFQSKIQCLKFLLSIEQLFWGCVFFKNKEEKKKKKKEEKKGEKLLAMIY